MFLLSILPFSVFPCLLPLSEICSFLNLIISQDDNQGVNFKSMIIFDKDLRYDTCEITFKTTANDLSFPACKINFFPMAPHWRIIHLDLREGGGHQMIICEAAPNGLPSLLHTGTTIDDLRGIRTHVPQGGRLIRWPLC